MRRLTSEFGMGSGRATASWSPKKSFNEPHERSRFLENYTQSRQLAGKRQAKSARLESETDERDQAARPISISPLNASPRLHA